MASAGKMAERDTDTSSAGRGNAMWGGRFADGPSAIMREINASIPFDKALWRQDIAGSRAHVSMLAAQGILSQEDANTIDDGLQTIAAEYERDGVPENWDLEDIHMTVESRLTELVGPVAGRLHTARSRNDQVATDFKLWTREAGSPRCRPRWSRVRSSTRPTSCPASPICRPHNRSRSATT